MKNFTIGCVAVIACLFSTNLKAQAYEAGNMVFSAGYGIGNFSKAIFKTIVNADDGTSGIKYSSIGPIMLKGEYAITDNFGIGLNIAHIGMGAKWTDAPYDYKVSWRNTSFNVRFNGYFVNTDNFLLYGGFGLGYRNGGYSFTSNDPSYVTGKAGGVPIGFELTGGFRVMFTENIGFYGEMGFAKGFLQAGLSYSI